MEWLALAVAFVALLGWDYGRRRLAAGDESELERVEADLRGEIATLGARLAEAEKQTQAVRSRSAAAVAEIGALTGSRRRKRGA